MGDLPIPPPEGRALIGSFFFACTQIVARRLMDRESALTVTVGVNAWMGVFAILLSPWIDSYSGNAVRALLMFAGVGLGGNGLARYCSYRSHLEIGVSRTNAPVAASPIGAVIVGMVLLGERPGPAVWLGGGRGGGGGVLRARGGCGGDREVAAAPRRGGGQGARPRPKLRHPPAGRPPGRPPPPHPDEPDLRAP